MNKKEFLSQLRQRLRGMPQGDIEDQIAFYSEMIADRMEEGYTEEEAVSAVGCIDEIVAQIVADIPLVKIAKDRITSRRRLTGLEVALLILGSPVWVSLLVSAIAVAVALYVSLWAVIVSLWSAFASLVGCALGGVIGGVWFLALGEILSGIATIAAGLVCGGLSAFAFWGCKRATQGAIWLTRKSVLCIKKRFIKKEGA